MSDIAISGVDWKARAEAAEAREAEMRADASRMSGCLIAICDAPVTATVAALKSVAYDAAMNCITPDIAEFQIERRSVEEIARGGDGLEHPR